ncbi:uncharacterized protein UDID_17269 [Ustilago sp. UG-2017a]|nr:uncharacterized protein UDID_17269 [Ustilago sp. UG-2017a]
MLPTQKPSHGTVQKLVFMPLHHKQNAAGLTGPLLERSSALEALLPTIPRRSLLTSADVLVLLFMIGSFKKLLTITMTDPNLNNKLDRLLALMEAQLELTRQGQREEQLRRAHLTEEATDLSHSEEQAGGGDESMIGDPNTPTPAPQPQRSVAFNLNEHAEANYEKYASPTGPKYLKTRVDPYSRNQMDPYAMDQEEEASIMTERSKPVATPFPKFNPQDIEIYILEAEAWFRFNQVYEHTRMINHLGSQLEGTAREWMEAYNKLLALRLTSDAPGAATHHVEQFRDLEGQVNLGDNELTIDLFRGSLTHSIQEKFERNPPKELWEVQFPFGDRLRNLIQLDHQLNLINHHNLIQPDNPHNTFLTQTTVLFSINPLQLQKEPQHHQEAATTPVMVDSLGSRPMGPKVMVITKDPFDEGTDSGDSPPGNTEPEQEDMDLRPYQQHMDSDHEEEQDDDDDEGNVRKAVLELSGMVQDHPAQILADTGAGLSIVSDSFISKYQITVSMQVYIGTHNLGVVEASVANTADYDLILGFTELRKLKPTIRWDMGQLEFKTQEQDRPPRRPPEAAGAEALSMKSPTLHGNEFVSAERILQAALEDGPIDFMLLEVSPSSLPAFGFVPTGADKGVEMEIEADKEVMAEDIPKPYQHLRDVFDEVEADKLPHHTEHDLHLELLEGGKPLQGPLYLKGPREMAELRKYLDENLEKGLCVDYRGLNEITVKNRAPLPLIKEQLFLLRKARIYTKLDLRAAYNLIRIAKGDEWKTVFGTQLGLYEYLVMPFGLANAPAHFQSFINDTFRDIIGVYVLVYLDDFLIFSDTEESHVKHVTEVLTRLRSNRLFAKLSKCEFHTKTVEFLGYIIKPTGIEMDPGKVRTVKEWPMPESIHDIQRFLGFANFYQRFIAHFAWIAKPLTSLVKPTERFKKFELPEEAQQAFHQLIQAFTSAGVLQHFDYHLPTRLETDASDFAIAGDNYERGHDRVMTRSPKQFIRLMRVFGCLAWVNIPKAKRNNKKLDQRAVAAIFIGYSLERKGWLFYSPDYSPNIFWSNSARFMETQFPTIEEDLDDLGYTEENLFDEREGKENDGGEGRVCTGATREERPARNMHNPETWVKKSYFGLMAAKVKEGKDSLNPTVHKALARKDRRFWEEAMCKELNGLEVMGTWEMTDLPRGMNTVDTQWVLKIKTDANLVPTKYKARLVVRGFTQREGLDYTEIFAPAIRGVLAIAAVRDWEVDSIDVKQAYLNSSLHHDVYLKPPVGTRVSWA